MTPEPTVKEGESISAVFLDFAQRHCLDTDNGDCVDLALLIHAWAQRNPDFQTAEIRTQVLFKSVDLLTDLSGEKSELTLVHAVTTINGETIDPGSSCSLEQHLTDLCAQAWRVEDDYESQGEMVEVTYCIEEFDCAELQRMASKFFKSDGQNPLYEPQRVEHWLSELFEPEPVPLSSQPA